MLQTQTTEEVLYIEIDGKQFEIVEGVEYTVPADEAEDMGASGEEEADYVS